MKHDRQEIDGYMTLRCCQTYCSYIADNIADAHDLTEDTLIKIGNIKYELYNLILELFGESQNG